MIERVYRQVEQAEGLARIVVLTDDERIVEAVSRFGGDVQLTPDDCASGTDRIAWAAATWQSSRKDSKDAPRNGALEAAAVVNIQGDEPLIDPMEISRVARHLADHPEDPVVTVAAPGTDADAADPEVVKVVLDSHGHALYFSRAPIPFSRQPEATGLTLCHLGIYGYQRSALLKIAAAEPTPLEQCESLEQLRMLENGIPIRVLESPRGWWGVDTIEDLERVEEILRREDGSGLAGAGTRDEND